MNHPYQAAYDLNWSDDYNGNLNEDDIKQRKAEWIAWVDTRLPLTLDIYKQMVEEQKHRYRRVRVWTSSGGLKVVSGGKAGKAYRIIRVKWMDIAAKRARAARKEAGWTGRNYLTSPTGIQTGPNGQYFGKFARPGGEFAEGVWDGVLRPDMTFTV
jgi:hypothetical protein